MSVKNTKSDGVEVSLIIDSLKEHNLEHLDPGFEIKRIFQTLKTSDRIGEYSLIDRNVSFDLLSVAANQREEFIEIFHYDWLPPKVRQN